MTTETIKLDYSKANELIDFIKDNNIADLADIQQKMELMKNKKILDSVNIWEQERNGVHYFVAHIKDENGKRKQVKSKSREGVEKKILAHYKELNREPTIEDLYREFKQHKVNIVKPNTLMRYDSDWNKISETDKTFIHLPFKSVKKTDFDEFLPKVIDTHQLNSKSFGSVCSLLRQMFTYACDANYLDKNPFRVQKVTKDRCMPTDRGEDDEETYTDEEIRLLDKEMNRRIANNPCNTAPLGVLLAFELGVRIGELMAINEADINWAEQTILIHSQLRAEYDVSDIDNIKRNGYKVSPQLKKNHPARTIPLTDRATELIRRIININRLNNYEKDGYLFLDEDGIQPPKAVEFQLSSGCEHIHIKYRSPHKMRKSYASTLINNNVPITVVQNRLGHTEPETTFRYYAFNNTDKSKQDEMVRNALNKRFEG